MTSRLHIVVLAVMSSFHFGCSALPPAVSSRDRGADERHAPGVVHPTDDPFSWAGENSQLTVESDTASLKTRFFRGSLPWPLDFHADGHFAVWGTMTPHWRPAHPEDSGTRPFLYRGTIDGDRLTFELESGPLTLRRGFTCRVTRVG